MNTMVGAWAKGARTAVCVLQTLPDRPAANRKQEKKLDLSHRRRQIFSDFQIFQFFPFETR